MDSFEMWIIGIWLLFPACYEFFIDRFCVGFIIPDGVVACGFGIKKSSYVNDMLKINNSNTSMGFIE